jgi:hypothetical protein
VPKQNAPAPTPLRLSVNTILGGKFIKAGEALPITNEEDLPENFRPFVVGKESPESSECLANFDLNVVYSTDAVASLPPSARSRPQE